MSTDAEPWERFTKGSPLPRTVTRIAPSATGPPPTVSVGSAVLG